MYHAGIVRFCALFALCFFTLTLPQKGVAATNGNLFNTGETKSTNLTPFPKWTGMLSRYTEEKKLETRPCVPTASEKCHLQEWRNFLITLKEKDTRTKLDEINRYMNQAEYILDIVNWGISDYWATPYQFLVNDGDCEDFAIAKYISLRMLGIPEQDMRVVILQDLNLNAIHAVLAVYIDGTPFVLDNQVKQVIPADKILHYNPVYSINAESWWRHHRL